MGGLTAIHAIFLERAAQVNAQIFPIGSLQKRTAGAVSLRTRNVRSLAISSAIRSIGDVLLNTCRDIELRETAIVENITVLQA